VLAPRASTSLFKAYPDKSIAPAKASQDSPFHTQLVPAKYVSESNSFSITTSDSTL
jgi:hypothetical protein